MKLITINGNPYLKLDGVKDIAEIIDFLNEDKKTAPDFTLEFLKPSKKKRRKYRTDKSEYQCTYCVRKCIGLGALKRHEQKHNLK